MTRIIIFGKPVTMVIKKSNRDFVRLRKNKLFVYFHKKPAELLVKDFLSSMLYAELYKIYEKVRKTGRIRIIGDLDFDIVDEIDNKRYRVAKLKGHTILVKLDAVKFPKRAIKYIVCHEMAHMIVKRHTKKFWEVLEAIYPNYKAGEKLMAKYKQQIL